MVEMSKITYFTGKSVVDNDGGKALVAVMTANIAEGEDISITHVIKDKELFAANKKDTMLDFVAFDQVAYKEAENGRTNEGVRTETESAEPESTETEDTETEDTESVE